MSVTKVLRLEDKTIFSIDEPLRYGEPDAFREVVVPHDPVFQSKLPTITKERVEHPRDDPYGEGVESMQAFKVPEVGLVVFVNDYDTETHSASYRAGAHVTLGPYLLVEDSSE